MTSSDRHQHWNGFSQLSIVAAVWCLHGAQLFFTVFSSFPSERLVFQERILVAIGLLGLLALEVGLLVAVFSAAELLRPRAKLALVVDLSKSLLLALLLTALGLSTIKFLSAGVHLKLSDLWFAYASAHQILQEVQSAELVAIFALPVITAILFGVVFMGFRRAREQAGSLSLRRWLPYMVGGAGALVLAHTVSEVMPTVVKGFVPEGNWVMIRRSHTGLLAIGDSEPLTDVNGAKIKTYVPGPAERQLNVVLLLLESIPWKRSWLNEETRAGVTPNLKLLAEESVVFDRAYAVSTHSCYAQLAILSSLHPRKYDHHDYYFDIQYPRTLIWDALKPAGYATALFSCQNERWGNMHKFAKTPGLDVYRHSLDWPNEPRKGRGDQSKVYEPTPVKKWKNWRQKRVDGSYFAYLNFQANHFPYEIPEDAERKFEPSEIDFAASYLSFPESKIPVMLNRFDNAQYYADQYVGEVIDFLKSIGDWDSTIFIVAADHGEAFYEHGHPTHGTTLHEEQVRTLLMMRVPGMEGRRVPEPVSMLDVTPTVLNVLGLEPHGNLQGRGDILEPSYDGSKRPIFFSIQGIATEDGVLLGDHKLIVNLDRESKQLFDLGSDPDELLNLSEDRPEDLKTMEQILGSFLDRQLRYYSDEEWKRGFFPPRLP